jgi:TonB family protein
LLADRAAPPRDLPAPAFDVVFEGGQPEQPEAEPPPGVEAPPAAEAAPPIAPAPPVETPPEPIPPTEPPPPVEAPPEPVPPAEPPPPVEAPPAAAPEPAPPSEPPPPDTAAPEPAPDLPPLPELADILPPPPELRLRERVPEAPRPPSLPPGAVLLPQGLQLGQPASPSGPPAGRPQARGLDLTVDPRLAEGRASPDPTVRVRGAEVGADWSAAFRRWLDQNIRYPRRAIELGEQGTVRVIVTAEPDGTVRSVRLATPSVSPSLNFGTTFPFQGAQLPPFPPPADPNGVTVELTVNYILIRR